MKLNGYATLALVGVAAIVAVTTLSPRANSGFAFYQEHSEFLRFIAKHNRYYKTPQEFEMRASLYRAAVALIEAENAKLENTFRLAVNKFADWTPEEKKAMLGYKRSEGGLLRDGTLKILPTDNLTASVDWRSSGAVGPVQN